MNHRRTRVSRALALLGIAWLAVPAGALDAQSTGRVVGRVLSAQTAEPLTSAQVYLEDGSIGGLTALDGRYVLRGVPAGSHDITVQLIGYAPKTVTGVVVQAGETVMLDVTMESQAVALEGVVVSAAAQRGTTTSLMTERKLASVVSDAIGADQISKSPDGDAAAALKRVPGLSVVDGKFAYVRGLGERYSSTTLNGAPLASPIPDKKVIPLDVIPSSLLQSIVTSKSYSPDQPGDYAGGLVQLRTQDFPSLRILSISLSGGWNSETSLQRGLGYSGGATDYLGFDDGTRGLPASIPRDMAVTRQNMSSEHLAGIGRAFAGDWGPTLRELPPNLSGGISYGDDFDLGGDRRLGFIASGNYSSSFTVKRNLVERVFAQSGVEDPEVDYFGEISERTVTLGGLVNVTFQPRASDQIKFATLYNHLAEDGSRVLQGFNLDSNTNQWNSRLQYLGQTLINTQLEGEHLLGFLGNTELSWRGAFTHASRYEPSTREALYRDFQGQLLWDDFIQSGSVFHQEMADDGWNGALSLESPFQVRGLPASLSLGASSDRKDRGAYTRRFRFRPVAGGVVNDQVRMLTPNDLFATDYIGPNGFEIQEATFRTDNYDAEQTIDAAYGMFDIAVTDALRLAGGARVERTFQSVTPKDLWAVGIEPVEGARKETTDILPALNATLEISPDMNIRGSASRTLARAQLRELAPFSFADYAGGYLVVGNPELGRTRVNNYDLRWEWFVNPQAVVAISGFYKSFDDPIEVTVLPSSELLKTWVNADGAENYGVEVELRSDLGFLSPGLESLSFNGNLTLVESSVQTGERIRVYLPGTGPTDLGVVARDRALQGQSPYVANLGLSWASLEGASASLFFNRFGRRIDTVGGQATPEVMEEARSQLDAVIEWPVTRGWKAKLSASRLLGSAVEFTQGGGTLRSYDLGRTVSLSVSWGTGR